MEDYLRSPEGKERYKELLEDHHKIYRRGLRSNRRTFGLATLGLLAALWHFDAKIPIGLLAAGSAAAYAVTRISEQRVDDAIKYSIENRVTPNTTMVLDCSVLGKFDLSDQTIPRSNATQFYEFFTYTQEKHILQ